ncbi:MAG: hypothetical protein Tp1111DCM1126091_78 [Prokaryotic dsDNA virus sp.]|nr:MAG: hypothetical protein Tp1111DCM1126091_78 [Prokaryotic dsDNA virus sp.]
MDKQNNLDTDFGSTLDFFGAINCVYVVYADNVEMYRSRVFSEALREFRKWTLQLNAALPSMGTVVEIKVLL